MTDPGIRRGFLMPKKEGTLNNIAMAQAVQRAVKPKFRGNATLTSKVVTHFPDNLVEEYRHIARQYMALLNKALKENLPEIRRAIDAERNEMGIHTDESLLRKIRRVMAEVLQAFEEMAVAFGLERMILRLADTTRKRSIREWKRIVQKTLGINILEDYYMGEFYRDTLRQWTANNVALIKSIPIETLTQVENVIQDGYLSGKTNKEISQKIQEATGVGRTRADFIARDQTAKLNADLEQQQQEDAGVEEYVWSDSGDERVRECHADLNGKRFKWSDPPEMWYLKGPKDGPKVRVYTGRFCHPKRDYRCRCVAYPVFNISGLNLPWEGGNSQ